MTTAATSLLGLALPVTGELQGTWGTTVNDSITSLLDTAVAGTTTLSTDSDVTLSTTTLAANQARQAIILWTANGTTTRNITAPAQSKIYTVINASAGTQSIVLRGAGPTTGVTIIKGESAVCAWNGSDFIKISNTGGSASFTNVTVSGTTTLSGLTASTALALNSSKEVVSVTNTGTGNNVLSASPTLTGTISAAALTLSSDLTLSGGTANGVLYLNGSKVATSGSALTFDGTSLNLLGSANDIRSTATGGASFTKLAVDGVYASGTDLYLFAPSSKFISFYANASEAMRLTSTGLGVGTSSPASKLHVVGTGTYVATFNNTADDTRIELQKSGTQYGQISVSTTALNLVGSQSNTAIKFLTNGGTVTAATIDSSGNLGLGVTPSAVSASDRVLQVRNFLFDDNSNGYGIIRYNNYYNGTNDVYLNTGAVSAFQMAGNAFRWYQAASGTAGDAITFTQAMTLDASGNLLAGATSTQLGERVNVTGAGILIQSSAATNRGLLGNFGGSDFVVGTYDSFALTFRTGNTERARIDSSGNFGIGTSSPSEKLTVNGNIKLGTSGTSWIYGPATTGRSIYSNSDSTAYIIAYGSAYGGSNDAGLQFTAGTSNTMVFNSSGNLGLGVTPSAWQSGRKAFQVGYSSMNSYSNSQIQLGANFYYDGTNNKYITTDYATVYQQINGQHQWYTAASGTAGDAITFTQAATLTAYGNYLVGCTSFPSASVAGIGITGTSSGNATSPGSSTSAYNHWLFYNGNGIVGSISTSGSTTTYSTSSDYRLKNITGPITNSGAYIDSLNPVEGTWKADGSTFVGLIAHEVQEASRTNVATGVKDGEQMQSMDYSSAEIIANLIAEIQSLRARVAALES